MKGRAWTKEDDNILRKIYPISSTRAVSDVLNRSVISVSSRAIKLNVRKFCPQTRAFTKGIVNLIHQENIVRTASIECVTELTTALGSWFKDIRPSLRRGEKLILEIQLDKRA